MSQGKASHRSPLHLGLALALVAAMLFAGFYPAQAQLPSNDAWEGAMEITSLPYSIDQDTTQATIGFDDPWPSCMYNTPYNSVWYKYTPSATTRIQVDASSSGTTYSAFLSIYTRSEAGFVEVNCSDHTAASITVQAGETYYFLIQAMWYGQYPPPVYGGNLHLSVNEISAPANDNFANAQIITEMPFSAAVDITFATDEGEENEPQSGCVET